MSLLDEELSAHFHRWEERARGWRVHTEPVVPEPPFTQFQGLNFIDKQVIDDGRKPGLFSSFIQSLTSGKTAPTTQPVPEQEASTTILEREHLVELPLNLPPSFTAKPQEFAQFLTTLAHLVEPVAFELIGTPTHITAQLATSAADASRVKQQIHAFFPDVVCTSTAKGLETALVATGESEIAVLEFGLAHETMLSLANVHHDLCVSLVGAMSALAPGEFALYQVLFQPVVKPWAENLIRSVTDASGDAFFVNGKELLAATKEKTCRPLFGAVVRIGVCAPEFDRVKEIARSLAGALSAFADPNGNELIPLHNHDYPLEAHIEDMCRRQSRRSGMLLNADELLGFIRFPTEAVSSPKFLRQTRKTKAAPAIATGTNGIILGANTHAGETTTVRLTPEQRVEHTHIIGVSGTGKSTLLFNLIRQDIEGGEGVGVLDPHGDLIDKILGIIPENRIKDVVLINPTDEDFIVGFNILSAHSDLEKNLLASDLVSIFRRLSTSWGDQMDSVLANTVRAFLESERGGTLADMRRFLLEPDFFEEFLTTVSDPDAVYYWKKVFPHSGGRKSIGPILTRFDIFLRRKPIRYMMSQAKSRLNFGEIMDGGKIFLARLAKGEIGDENSYLLGSLFVTKFHQLAMSRQSQQVSERRDFWLYLDEFQNFITPSMAEILTGARKYRIGFTLAHHELRQLQVDPNVASAVLSNPYTRINFRVGDQDARVLESNFSAFEARDLQNLGKGEAICRVERRDYDFSLTVLLPEYPDPNLAAIRRNEVIAESRRKYALPSAEVEAAISASMPSALLAASTTATEENKPQTKRAAPPVATEAAPSVAPVLAAPAEPTPLVREEKLVAQPADPGYDTAEQKAIRHRIFEAADALKFRVTSEKPTPDGAGRVDLVLERDGMSIAVEISVTTKTGHELGNISKCVKAGFSQIAVISVDEAKLDKLAGLVARKLGPDVAALVGYYTPDGFLAALANLPPPAPPTPEFDTVRGWKVKSKLPVQSPEKAKAREDALIKYVAEGMKKAQRKP